VQNKTLGSDGFSFLGSKSLTVFARSPTWIAPQVASDTPMVDPKGANPPEHRKHYYIEDEKRRFREDPEFFLKYRKGLETKITKSFPLFLRGSPLNIYAKKAMRERMLNLIGTGHEELKEKLIPTWSPGCRRLTVSWVGRRQTESHVLIFVHFLAG